MNFVQTEVLNIAFEIGGPQDGPAVFLLHGWPDSPVGWQNIALTLQQFGYRTIVPYLRGSHPTEFLFADTPRFAGAVALAQDVIDLAEKLEIPKFSVVGHDWGGRTAYTLAALFPEKIQAIASLAIAYQPRGEFHLGSFVQSRQFWYQFFQCTDAGAEAVRHDPVGFARIQWETWSPEGWFQEEDFEAASRHFDKPDWTEITLNAYRSRYLKGEVFDPRYEELQKKLQNTFMLQVPALMIQGDSDFCDRTEAADGQERYFSNGYRRIILEGVGHFPHREAPAAVLKEVLELLG